MTEPRTVPHRIVFVENLAEVVLGDNSGFKSVKTGGVLCPERELEKIQKEYPGYELEVTKNTYDNANVKERCWIVELRLKTTK